jgi:hypothetical protein
MTSRTILSAAGRVLLSATMILALLILASGCDRTRPYPGLAQPSGGAAPAAPVVKAPAGGAAQAPSKTDAGWRFTLSAPAAANVSLAGTFNSWNTSADPLTKGDDGVWFIVRPLDPGSHQYKFVVNGSEWKTDPANPESADDGYGGKNSLLVVP